MQRRKLITLICGAAAAWPPAAHTLQQEGRRRIGLLMILGENDPQAKANRDALTTGLQQFGWVPERNILLDYRWAAGDADRLPDLAKDLLAMAPDLIIADGTPGLAAVRQATQRVPIVFTNVTDPVGQGFVESLARPRGNVTGFTLFEFSMAGKWVEILRDLVPSINRLGFLYNPPMAPYSKLYLRPVEEASRALQIEFDPLPVENGAAIERALAMLAQSQAGLIVLQDAFTAARRDLIIDRVARYRIPAVYTVRLYALSGGLISYGADFADQFRQAAGYVDRILKGANPGELPVQQPTKFELVINLKTARTLAIDVPPMLLARADEVIE
jgi:putative ABC transport system substrate-binding protein